MSIELPDDAIVGHRYWTAILTKGKPRRVYGYGNWTWKFPGVNQAVCKCGRGHKVAPPKNDTYGYTGCGIYAQTVPYTTDNMGYFHTAFTTHMTSHRNAATMHIVGEVYLWGNQVGVTDVVVRAQYGAVKSLHVLPVSGPVYNYMLSSYGGHYGKTAFDAGIRSYNRKLRDVFEGIVPITTITKRAVPRRSTQRAA